MHINSIIITKQFISHWNLNGFVAQSVGVHIHVGYMFLKSNKQIVFRNPKSKIFFYFI